MWVSPSPSPAQLQPPSPVLGASGALERPRTGLHCGRSIESPASSDRLPHCCCCWWWCINTGEYWHLSPPVTSSFCQTLNQRGDMIQPINRMGHGDEGPDNTCDDMVTRGRGRGTQACQAGSCSLGRDWARGKQRRDPGQDADTKVRFTAFYYKCSWEPFLISLTLSGRFSDL